MTYGKFGGFFVDSCILLPKSVESTKQSCAYFLEKNGDRCLISSSIKNEGLDLLNRSYSVVVKDITENLKPFLETQGIKEITNKRGRLFADFFSQRRRIIKKTHQTKSNVPNELLGAIENYVAARLHSLKDGQKLDVNLFLAALLRELSIEKYKLKRPFEKLKCILIAPDSALCCLVISAGKVKNRKDAEHLVSSIMHQFDENEWMIFVSNDDDHILSNKTELLDIFALQCSKPDWAIDYCDFISRRKTPIEHYRELKNYSEHQRTFGSHIERINSIKILS